GEDHAVPEVLVPSVRLGYGLAGRRPRKDEAEAEVRVQLPVHIPVQLGSETAGGDAGAQRCGLVEQKAVVNEARPDVFRGGEVQSNLVRDEVRVRGEVLACDLALPPAAPVVESQEQRVELFAPLTRGIVPFEEGKPVREPRLPGDVELVAAL